MKYPTTNELRHKISLYTLAQATDDYGQSAMTFTLFRANVPAKMVVKSSREDSLGDKRVSSYKYEFTVRYNQPVDANMIIQYDGRFFSIQGVEDKEGTGKVKTIVAYEQDDNQGIIE